MQTHYAILNGRWSLNLYSSLESSRKDLDVRQLPDFNERLKGLVREFRASHEPHNFRSLRLLCHGCTLYIPTKKYTVIGDPDGLDALLRHIMRYRKEPLRFRRLFHGLLKAYLDVERQADWFDKPSVRAGNEKIRSFLWQNFPKIRSLEPTPDWVLALDTYREVISDDPGSSFAEDWLTGEGKAFRDASTRLALTGNCWLAAEILGSAVAAACKLSDAAFKNYIPAFLKDASEPRFQSLRDATYAALLERYSAAGSLPLHAGLRDAVVGAWKNPWLKRNDSAWERVSDCGPQNGHRLAKASSHSSVFRRTLG